MNHLTKRYKLDASLEQAIKNHQHQREWLCWTLDGRQSSSNLKSRSLPDAYIVCISISIKSM